MRASFSVKFLRFVVYEYGTERGKYRRKALNRRKMLVPSNMLHECTRVLHEAFFNIFYVGKRDSVETKLRVKAKQIDDHRC